MFVQSLTKPAGDPLSKLKTLQRQKQDRRKCQACSPQAVTSEAGGQCEPSQQPGVQACKVVVTDQIKKEPCKINGTLVQPVTGFG